MDSKRKKLVLEFWDRSKVLSLDNKGYYFDVKTLIYETLREDIGKGDITTDTLIGRNAEARAHVIARQDGIVAGIEESLLIFSNNGVKIKKYKQDGDEIKKNDILFEFHGNARKILSCERTLLNLLQRMSGIATLTYNTKALANGCFIAGTRKTLFPLLDKKAISVGGALTHRLNLSDAVLIKDSHLEVLNNSFEKALRLVIENSKTDYIEIEVKNEEEALKAANAISKIKSKKPFAIMFDNMGPQQIKNSVDKIKSSYKTGSLLFEASGGINQENIGEYSKTGVDIISLGFLTHSAKALDMSLEILRI